MYLTRPVGSAEEDLALLALQQSPTYRNILAEVEDRAKAGVIEATKTNAIALFLMALAAGSLGGTLFTGPGKVFVAAGVALYAGHVLTNAQVTAGTTTAEE